MNFTAGSLNSKSPDYRARYDDRKGLGYGVLDPQYHVAHPGLEQHGGRFPYAEPDIYPPDDEDIGMDNDEMDAFITKINKGVSTYDSMGGRSRDRFYMFGANTSAPSLAGESARMIVNPTLASPIPSSVLYPNGFDAALGGGTSMPIPFAGPTDGFRTLSRPTGTKQGIASSPAYTPMGAEEFDEPIHQLQDIPEDDERALDKLRKIIALIYKEQDLAECWGIL